MENKSIAEKIKNECMRLLTNKAIFNNYNTDFVDKYRLLYSNKQVLAVLNNESLISTASVFLKNNLNITIASKKGYMHRNTLIYRIDKIKRLIGLDIRNFEEAVVFENLVMFSTLIKAHSN